MLTRPANPESPRAPTGRSFTALALVALSAAILSCLSCGSKTNSSGFEPGSSGSTMGGGDEGGSPGGDDGGGTGLFGPVGTFGDSGPASSGSATPPPGTVLPATIDQCGTGNPGGLSAQTVSSLQKGGPVDPAMKWLYPYDGTVFPGGILSPLLMWATQAGGADGVYLHLKSQAFEYKACIGPKPNGQLPMPNSSANNFAWSAAWDHSAGPSDPLTVELTTIVAGKVSGPIRQKWMFAKGSLKGVLYYNTYNSNLLAPTDGGATQNGAIMKIAPSGASPSVLISIAGSVPSGPCISCHSVSASGSLLVAQRHYYGMYPGGLQAPGSESFDLLSATPPNPSSPLASRADDDWGFSGVYPDGSLLLTAGQPTDSNVGGLGFFPFGTNNNPGMVGPKSTTMYDTKTGAPITFSGLNIKYAMMPMFSPDGKKVVFNDYDSSGSNHSGHSLMVMDFDPATKTFANPKSIFSDPNKYPGWPFFTPDASRVIFALGDSERFATINSGPNPTKDSDIAQGDLTIVDIASGQSHALDAANGYTNGALYLPFPGRDDHRSYYPTVSPVPAGGYFWAYFTSRRNYGNRFQNDVWDSAAKKIWVAAVDINAPAGTDPSHPAFYLPGQENQSGNIRAFAALNPCKADGMSCETGVDCCGGSCDPSDLKCGQPSGCALIDNRCKTTSDCCADGGPVLQCVGGVCTQIVN